MVLPITKISVWNNQYSFCHCCIAWLEPSKIPGLTTGPLRLCLSLPSPLTATISREWYWLSSENNAAWVCLHFCVASLGSCSWKEIQIPSIENWVLESARSDSISVSFGLFSWTLKTLSWFAQSHIWVPWCYAVPCPVCCLLPQPPPSLFTNLILWGVGYMTQDGWFWYLKLPLKTEIEPT